MAEIITGRAVDEGGGNAISKFLALSIIRPRYWT